MKKAEASAKKNPALLKEKVKVKDYAKLEKLHKKTEAELKKCKTDAQVNDTMNKYRKQRNLILGAGAVVVITLGAIFLYTKKKGKDAEAELNDKLSQAEFRINELTRQKEKYVAELAAETQKRAQLAKSAMKDRIDANKAREERDAVKIKLGFKELDCNGAWAQVEMLRNAAQDSVAQQKEFAAKWMRVGAAAAGVNEKRKLARTDPQTKTAAVDEAVSKYNRRLDAALAAEHKDYAIRLRNIKRLKKELDDQDLNKFDKENIEEALAYKEKRLLDLRKKYNPF